MSFEATVIDGVIVPDAPVELEEGTKVMVERVPPKPTELSSLSKAMLAMAGTIDDPRTDGSTQLDHYLYGTPKR